MSTRTPLPALLAVALLLPLGCKQQAGDVCQRYPNRESDCAEGLICCGTPQVCPGEVLPAIRGICTPTGMCADDVEPVCDDAGVVPRDAAADASASDGSVADGGPADDGGSAADAGSGDAGGADASTADAGADAGTDAGTDAGGVDAGSTDAGSSLLDGGLGLPDTGLGA